METSKEYHINNSSIKVTFGNILDSQADVIVSSDDSRISMGGGVSHAIRKKEGTEAILQDVKKRVPAEIGEVIVSTAGTLPQKNIFHIITIDRRSLGRSKKVETVSKEDIHRYIIGHSIDRCFSLLHALDLKSIAFPAIGAGSAGFPYDKVAAVMSEAIARNLRKTNKIFSVELYLMDRYDKMEPWDFLPMFEQFSAQEVVAKMLNKKASDQLILDVTESPQQPVDSTRVERVKKDIFISYSRKDSALVKPIYEWLIKEGCQCWLDVDGMLSGVSFKQVIADAIKRSKVFLFMSSENSNKSANVVSEVSIAMQYGTKIIPVRLDMSEYQGSILYDLVNHDFVIYDSARAEQSNYEMLKKIVSTMEMI